MYGIINLDYSSIIVPEEAEIIKRIYREYLEGQSLVGIGRDNEKDSILNEELFEDLEIMDYAKQKQVRLNFTLNVNKYNEYWDYFTQFKIWSNNAMKKSYIEFMCRYSIEWSGKSVSEILNNKTEWFSYLTKELVYLLKNYYDIIEPWIYRRWGDEKMEPKINIDYIKKEG